MVFPFDSSSAGRQNTYPMLPLSWNANRKGGMLFILWTGCKWKTGLFLFLLMLLLSLTLSRSPHLTCHCLSYYSFCCSVFSFSPDILFTVWFGHSFSPWADKTTPDLSKVLPPMCTHIGTLPSANHTQEMGSQANEARLASGTRDGVLGL